MRMTLLIVLLLVAAFAPRPTERSALRVSSKKFTESVILGEMLMILSADSGHDTTHLRELGGSRLVFEALQTGEIDAYAEYTGTLINELLAKQNITSDAELRAALDQLDIGISRPLGFNNTYALGLLPDLAAQHQLRTISDLNRTPDLKYGFGNEFLERHDGWPGLQAAYGLSPASVAGMDHDIAWQQLQLKLVDVIDVYTTEARIAEYQVTLLHDDRQYFPRYDAVVLYRKQSAEQYPNAFQSILRLEDQISESDMTQCNRRVEIGGESEQQVAADFVQQKLNITSDVVAVDRWQRILGSTIDHLELVRRSLLPAILVAVPLGIVAARYVWLGHIVLAVTGVLQTIPAFALLVLLLPVVAMLGLSGVGSGSATAVLALFLYSLLPIVRNTHAGITGIDPALRESADVLNLPPRYRLLHIELPLASRSILAGIKTAAVMNIGFATLGALVGAGGYGQPILSGIRLAQTSLILEGAVPAAVLALAAQASFEVLEYWAVPKGLRTVSAS